MTDARGRRRVGRWLGKLADAGHAIMLLMKGVVAYRRSHGAPRGMAMAPGSGRLDLNVVWDLVARAMRWTRALRVRLKAEAKAARAGMEPRESLFDAPDWHENLMRLPGTRAPKPAPDDCIDNKPTAEVVAQICADLAVAARLMNGSSKAKEIEAIAAEARALLGGPDEAWSAAPIALTQAPVPAEPAAALQSAAAGTVAPLPAPDTG